MECELQPLQLSLQSSSIVYFDSLPLFERGIKSSSQKREWCRC